MKIQMKVQIMVQICNHMAHVAICDTSYEQVPLLNLETSFCSILTMIYLMRVEARSFVSESVCNYDCGYALVYA
jgi:hypothetical protein